MMSISRYNTNTQSVDALLGVLTINESDFGMASSIIDQQSEYRQIPLTQGKHAIVDEEDYEFLSQWKWCYHFGYAVRTQYFQGDKKDKRIRKFIKMHRFILNTPNGMDTDHINMNKLDNRRKNLRVATRSQNQANKKSQINSSSQYKGVGWHKRKKKWTAQISVNNRLIHLGGFSTEEKAALAYNEAAKKYYGEFGRFNIVNN